MVKKYIFLPLIVLSLLIISFESYANVLFQDVTANGYSDGNISILQETIATGVGQEGDYELIACSTTGDGGNLFADPSPGLWTTLDNTPCGGNGLCQLGIWGRFTNNPASEIITCSWDFNTFVFAAGSFRYDDVDPDPIIDVQCNSGTGTVQTAPSIDTEAGSHVARIFTYSFSLFQGGIEVIDADVASETFFVRQFTTFQNIQMNGSTDFFEFAGPTGAVDFFLAADTEWRACTIGIRMVPLPRNVPTMSEWGLIAFAAFAGIAGLFYLRRRQLAA